MTDGNCEDCADRASYLTEIARVGDTKKIWQLEYLGDEQLMVVLAGKQRQLRLVPVRALDADEVEWTKVGGSGSG